MLALLLSPVAALVIDLVPRLAHGVGPGTGPTLRTHATPPRHRSVGARRLVLALGDAVLNELEPFVAGSGWATPISQALALAAVSALPVAVLLNRLPRFAIARVPGSGGMITSPGAAGVISMNVIVAAALTMVIMVLATALALESAACSIVGPSCD